MSFCPKCRYEYDIEIDTCPDCGVKLVENLDATDKIYNDTVYYDEEKEYIEKLAVFIKENGIKNVSVNFNEETNLYELATDTSSKNKVRELLNMYFEAELKEEAELDGEDGQEFEAMLNQTQQGLHGSSFNYVKKSDKYKDYRSTGIMLIIMGIAGDLYIILTLLSVISLSFSGISAVMFYIVMGILFNVFLVGGIMSINSANKIKGEIGTEEKLTQDIKKHIRDNYTREFFEEKYSGLNEEERYFDITDFLRKEIAGKFGELDGNYIENIIELLYQEIFE